MKLFQHIIARLLILTVLFAALTLTSAPALAQLPPMIRVDPVWRPPTQLTTIDLNGNGDTDSGDDIRYVTMDIYATTTVQFSAVGFTCYVNRLALEKYTEGEDANAAITEDDMPMFTVGADWVTIYAPKAPDTTNFDADGKLNFAIAVAGDYNPPLGSNGVSETLHIASLRFRVKEGLTLPTVSAFSCTTQFLNRDGRVVVPAAFYPPPYLSILPGYTLTGKVTYQTITGYPTAQQAIEIWCIDPTNAPRQVLANVVTGLFSLTNLRTRGRYSCEYRGNIITTTTGSGPDLHLSATTEFNLTGAAYALLPVTLRSGNVDRATPGSEQAVDTFDVSMVTMNWNVLQSLPYQSGDANGDRMVNEVDLALVAGNYGSCNFCPGPHLIYSLPRDYLTFQNSHLWLGSYANLSQGSANVTQFVPGNTRDYWPALSPDGSRIAFTRNVGVGSADRFVLYTATITNGVVGPAIPLTPLTAPYDAFAPSWSPTGERLAFVCSYNDEWFSAASPHGNLCLIDSRGLNFQQVQGEFGTVTRPVTVKIYPPAWVGSKWIYFGYSALSGTPEPACDNTICYITLTNNAVSGASLAAGSEMPVVREGILGPTLFYYVDLQGIRYARLNPSSALPQASYPTANQHHDAFFANVSIPYFTVSTGADPDIFVYRSGLQWGDGGSLFTLRTFTGSASVPAWTGDFGSTYRVSDGVGNPALTSPYYEALRNTVAFVP